jgi:AcrR family transcriptional regulator
MKTLGRNENSTSQATYRAAVELFYKQGYGATSLRQIADRVGVQVGSLYNYINSKEEVLLHIMSGVLDDLIVAVESEMAQVDDPVGKIEAFMHASIRFHGTHRRETFIGNSELRALSPANRKAMVAKRDRYEQMLATAIHNAVEAGVLHVDDEQMAAFAGLAICSHVASWYRSGHRLGLDQVASYLSRMYGPTARSAVTHPAPRRGES